MWTLNTVNIDLSHFACLVRFHGILMTCLGLEKPLLSYHIWEFFAGAIGKVCHMGSAPANWSQRFLPPKLCFHFSFATTVNQSRVDWSVTERLYSFDVFALNHWFCFFFHRWMVVEVITSGGKLPVLAPFFCCRWLDMDVVLLLVIHLTLHFLFSFLPVVNGMSSASSNFWVSTQLESMWQHLVCPHCTDPVNVFTSRTPMNQSQVFMKCSNLTVTCENHPEWIPFK